MKEMKLTYGEKRYNVEVPTLEEKIGEESPDRVVLVRDPLENSFFRERFDALISSEDFVVSLTNPDFVMKANRGAFDFGSDEKKIFVYAPSAEALSFSGERRGEYYLTSVALAEGCGRTYVFLSEDQLKENSPFLIGKLPVCLFRKPWYDSRTGRETAVEHHFVI